MSEILTPMESFRKANYNYYNGRPYIPFNYLLPFDCKELYNLFKKFPGDEIQKIMNKFYILEINDFWFLYPYKIQKIYHAYIYMILLDDIKDTGIYPRRTYQDLIKLFGHDLVDKFITDKETIKKNIKITIDDVFCNFDAEEIVVSIEIVHDLNAADIINGKMSSTPDIFEELLYESYDVVSKDNRPYDGEDSCAMISNPCAVITRVHPSYQKYHNCFIIKKKN